jgi:hypothetical protein
MEAEADDLRQKADHCRFLARQILDPPMRKILLDAAAEFEQEAFELERKARRKG